MFYALAIGSMLAYAIQNTLLVHHARKIDGLSLAFYRNISFVITLSPLLLGASAKDILHVLSHWPLLLFAAITGGFSLSLAFGAYRFLGVSFSGCITAAVATLSTAALGWMVLSERIPTIGILFIAVTVAGVLVFGFHYRHFPHLDEKLALGIAMAFSGGILVSLTKFSVSVLSREANPLVSGYFWETTIGVACGILVLARGMFLKKKLQRIKLKKFLIIAACTSPTLIGTGLFCLASRSGPIAVVGAVGSGGLVVISLLAWTWYHERIEAKQWAGIALILAGIVGLRFV